VSIIREAYRNRENYSEYSNSCTPMSRINKAQSNSHRTDHWRVEKWNQSDSNLHYPAVTDMVPIIVWPRAIFAAAGWTPCEWPNNINPPRTANNGKGVTHMA